MAPTLKLIKPNKETGTSVDTILVTKAIIKDWKLPPFQRPLRVNAKVLLVAEGIKRDEVFPGILTIGILKGQKYIVDGQHRCHAFELSGLDEAFTDVRYRYYDSMEEMAEDFVNLNSQMVKMGPDDILRGLESTNEGLVSIRARCPFVGYDQIRRGTSSPIVSMSAALRCWYGAKRDVPASVGHAASALAKMMTQAEADEIVSFLNSAMGAWGKDKEYHKLWGNLNVTLCMWLYQRVVLRAWSPRAQRITKEQFRKLLTALTASPDYLEWLVGRQMSDRDRSPGYKRMKAIFIKRLEMELGKKTTLPAPEWVSS
jgi:hypothetical protein